MPRPLIEPPREVLQLVLDEAIRPLLRDLEGDLKVSLELTVENALLPGVFTDKCGVGREPWPSPPVVGVLRVSFRANYGGDRFLFRAEAVFPKTLSPETGFSGFNRTGAVDVAGGVYTLVSETWSVHYKKWDFTPWK